MATRSPLLPMVRPFQFAPIDWAAVDAETLKHFTAIVQIDSTDPPTTPPGVEKPVVDYLRSVLEGAGIPTETIALDPNRPNLVARMDRKLRAAMARTRTTPPERVLN